MELTFLGRGAGFNPGEGSTAAFFVDNGELFLIDSGESVFGTLLEGKHLDSISALNMFITHTHSDHAGSLGSLILYAYMVKKIPVNIIFDQNMGYLSKLRVLFGIYGLKEDMYRLADAAEFDGKYSLFARARYVKTMHCNELESCGILFETEQGLVFYSGDIHDPAPIAGIIDSGKQIDKIFVDVNNDTTPNMHHLSVHQLNGIIPAALKSRVHCMHFNNSQCIAEAQAYGFCVVSAGVPHAK